jgi:hypothetical protein
MKLLLSNCYLSHIERKLLISQVFLTGASREKILACSPDMPSKLEKHRDVLQPCLVIISPVMHDQSYKVGRPQTPINIKKKFYLQNGYLLCTAERL